MIFLKYRATPRCASYDAIVSLTKRNVFRVMFVLRSKELSKLDRISSLLSIVIKHFDRVKRVVGEISSYGVKFLQQIVGHCDNVAPDRVGLENIQKLARASPDQLLVRA